MREVNRGVLSLVLSLVLSDCFVRASLTDEYSISVWMPKDGLPHHTILGITQTPEGYVWVATGAGLARFDGAQFKLCEFKRSEGTNQIMIIAIQCDMNGALWIVTDAGHVVTGRAAQFTTLTTEQGSPPVGAHGVYGDGRKQIIVSDREGKVFRATGKRLGPWLDTRGIAPGTFAGINVESGGTVWVRHGRTLSWWTGERWQRLLSPKGAEDFEALKTGASPNGGMWISTRTGLRKFRNGQWETREFAYAQPVNSVQAIFEDSRGDVWVTLGFDGIMRFDGAGRRESIGVTEGLSHASVRHIFEDAEGNLWLGTEGGGLTVLSPRHASAPSPAAPANPASVRRPWPTPRAIVEELWADSRLRWEMLSPTVRTNVGSGVKSGTAQVILPASTSVVEAQYTALNFASRGPFRFECRLQGLDRNWMDAGTNRRVAYTNLAPGRYDLQVRAGNTADVWGEPCEAFAFIVKPHVWQTWTFRLLVGGALALGLLGWQRAHVHQLERQRVLEQSFSRRLIELQETERQRIAAELHDGVGQKLLIIKNSAQLGLRDTRLDGEVSEQLKTVSHTASECLDEIRQIARNLRPYQLDQMGLTKAIRSLATQVEQSSGLRLRLDMDDLEGLFPSSAEINVYRVVQEALSNILRHARATEALLRIERLGREVAILISDNGHGFAPVSGNGPGPNEGGFGLTNMRQRVQILGGKLEIQAAPDLGTKLNIRLPIDPATHEN